MTSDIMRLVGAFCTGSAAVAVAGYLLHKRLTAGLLADLEATRKELAEVMVENRRLKNGMDAVSTDADEEASEPEPDETYSVDEDDPVYETADEMNAEETAYLDSERRDGDLHVEYEDRNPDPHRIEYQTYLYTNPEWSKVEVEYYLGDETLVDDNDDVLPEMWFGDILGVDEPFIEYWTKCGRLPELWWRVPSMEMDVDVLVHEAAYFGEDGEG